MPNWCTNQLIVCGPVTWIDLFHEKITVGGGYEIMNNLYPCPEDLTGYPSRHGTIPDSDPDKERKLANVEKYDAVDWYDWCITNWGTKWADCHTQKVDESETVDHSLKKVMFRFDSAWSPPVEAFDTIAMLFPKLMFDLRYEEPGMCFQGFRIWGDGEQQGGADMDYMASGEMVYDQMDWDYDEYVTVLGEDND